MSNIKVTAGTQLIVIDPETTTVSVNNSGPQQIVVDSEKTTVSVINAGPQGPPGGGVGSNLYYRHNQDVPSNVWTIHHGLSLKANVSIFDSTDEEVDADIIHVDDNTTTITFAYSISGYAIFS